MQSEPQMMPGGMTPIGWDWGSMWLTLIVPSLVVLTAVIIILAFFLRREEPPSAPAPVLHQTLASSVQATEARSSKTSSDPPNNEVLAEVIRSLAPTLADDERRVMDEMVKAGGEMLQSELPRMTDFSKATVSKAIHGLEVRGIVVRERHKWTYWCKVNPRLVQRIIQEQADSSENRPLTT